MDRDMKILLKRAVEIASERGGDTSNEDDNNIATTNLDAMIFLEEAIQRAFGLEAHEWRKINKIIDKM